MLELVYSYGVYDQRYDPQYEFGLCYVLHCHLMRHENNPRARLLKSVRAFNVFKKEHPLPWNEDVIKNHNCVLFVKPRCERMIVGGIFGKRLSAYESKPFS